jgi:hypothetical protein
VDSNDKNEKVILKRSALPGVDMSIVDLELVSTVKIRVTIVKKAIFKIKGKTFIGTRDQLDKMDVIQLGNFKLKYRVMKLEKMTDYDGYIYRIKRMDGNSTTNLDINATAIGQKVGIVNRPTFDSLFNYACSLRQEVLKEEEDCYTGEACDKKSPITQTIPCATYEGGMDGSGYQEIAYLNCEGEPSIFIHEASNGVQPFKFCGRANQDIFCPQCKEFYYTETLGCT